jgi:predicted SAM-dependent methyltransferase
MKYLNLGCGSRFHSSWTNVNFTSTGKDVIACNLNNGIPFSDNSFDVIYHSHILEHFSKNQALFFLKECYRVLCPEGILRVVVPDLEMIAKTYLLALEKARNGDEQWGYNYQWILLEMYDQTVRNKSGGEMKNYLFNPNLPNQDFVIERCGLEVEKIINSRRQKSNSAPKKQNQKPNFFKKIYQLFRHPRQSRELLLKLLLNQEYEALKIGRFRLGGEVHQWMYDSYSLSELLKNSGFDQIIQRQANESYIPEWTTFNLDTQPDGIIYKPDSLFMEAIKLN